MSQTTKKKYWNRKRLIASCIWLLLFLAGPFLLTCIGWLDSDQQFIVQCLLFPSVLLILSDHYAFKITIATVIVITFFGLPNYQPLPMLRMIEELNYRVRNIFFQVRGYQKTTDQVVVVDLDEKSIQAIGQWPWPRTWIAHVIDILEQDGAKVIGFDMVFDQEDRLSFGDWLPRVGYTGLLNEQLAHAILTGETSNYPISAQQVKEILAYEWLQRLGKGGLARGRTLDAPSRKKAAIAAYREWASEQGYSFSSQSDDDGEVWEHMLRYSSELFYVDYQGNVKQCLESGATLILDNDADFAKRFQSAKVVAGGFLLFSPADSNIGAQELLSRPTLLTSRAIAHADEIFPYLRSGRQAVVNIPAIQQQAKRQGVFNMIPDGLGVARHYTLLLRTPRYTQTLVPKEGVTGADLLDFDNYEEKVVAEYPIVPSLALEMFCTANQYDAVEGAVYNGRRGLLCKRTAAQVDGEEDGLLPRAYFIPVDTKGDLHINYLNGGLPWDATSPYSKEYYFPYVSLSDVIQKKFDPGTFKGKYVVIGSTDPTFHDLIASPYHSRHPGLVIHANMLDNLISGAFIVDDLDRNLLINFFGVLLGGIVCAALVSFTEALWAGIWGTLILVTLPVYSYWEFTQQGQVFDFVYFWLSALLIMIIALLVNFFVAGRESRFIAKQFSTMVSGELLEKLRDDPGSVSLEGQKATISVMFSDVAGFTTISEKLSPQDLVKVLNDYLTPMTNIILQHQGFIDKFIGDAIMACWGVPFPYQDHAIKACYACLEQQKALIPIAQEIKTKYGVELCVRMGISSGEVSAALMGSEQRKSYTVMGDVVNLGARLEPACKDYHILILISEKTYLSAKDHIEARCIDKIVVKGKTIPIPVYELMAKKGELSSDAMNKKMWFEEALYLHWERKWDEALAKLEAILAIDSEDGPTLNLLKRIEFYKINPPGANWQGENH